MKKMFKVVMVILALGIFSGAAQAEVALLKGVRAANKGACENNLKAIGDLIGVYVVTEGAQLPKKDNAAGLADFGGGYSQCASRHFKSDKETKDPVEKENSYIYFGGFDLDAITKGKEVLPLVFDKPGNNHLNVLFADMHVESFPNREFKSCTEIIEFLNKEKKYSKEQLKTLQEKAKKVDEQLGYGEKEKKDAKAKK